LGLWICGADGFAGADARPQRGHLLTPIDRNAQALAPEAIGRGRFLADLGVRIREDEADVEVGMLLADNRTMSNLVFPMVRDWLEANDEEELRTRGQKQETLCLASEVATPGAGLH
jgi:hypothetical protein